MLFSKPKHLLVVSFPRYLHLSLGCLTSIPRTHLKLSNVFLLQYGIVASFKFQGNYFNTFLISCVTGDAPPIMSI